MVVGRGAGRLVQDYTMNRINAGHKSEVYLSGKSAFYRGDKLDWCPFKIGDSRRTEWMCGWLDTRSAVKFGKLFRRYGLIPAG